MWILWYLVFGKEGFFLYYYFDKRNGMGRVKSPAPITTAAIYDTAESNTDYDIRDIALRDGAIIFVPHKDPERPQVAASPIPTPRIAEAAPLDPQMAEVYAALLELAERGIKQ